MWRRLHYSRGMDDWGVTTCESTVNLGNKEGEKKKGLKLLVILWVNLNFGKCMPGDGQKLADIKFGWQRCLGGWPQVSRCQIIGEIWVTMNVLMYWGGLTLATTLTCDLWPVGACLEMAGLTPSLILHSRTLSLPDTSHTHTALHPHTTLSSGVHAPEDTTKLLCLCPASGGQLSSPLEDQHQRWFPGRVSLGKAEERWCEG